MKRRLVMVAGWCTAHPLETRLAILLALILATAFLPGNTALAGDVPGGGHPYP